MEDYLQLEKNQIAFLVNVQNLAKPTLSLIINNPKEFGIINVNIDKHAQEIIQHKKFNADQLNYQNMTNQYK